MPFLDREGVRIHYHVAGDGPGLLASHGFTSSSHVYDQTVPALTATHQVITWDLRGHGRSDYPADPAAYSVSLAVGDMVAILDAVGVERAALMGHSLGGFLSLELQRTHPDRVAGLVLVDTGPGYRRDDTRAAWNGMAERFASALETDGLAALERGDEVRADVHRNTDGLAKAARGILRQENARVLDHLPAVDVPTLVLVGEHDANFLKGCSYMADKIPGARHVIVSGAHHAPMVSHPEVFYEAVTTFLAGLDDGDRRPRPN